MIYTTPFSQLNKTDIPRAGGKGANLGEMTAAGFPVPAGFVLTTGAYDDFVATHGLREPIVNLAQTVSAIDPQSSETASGQIKQLFLDAEMPAEIAEAIMSATAELGEASVAVRSSATAEDLIDASFAGQQETYLNVQGRDALLGAVKQCWASLWTARALSYRARQEIAPDAVALAVIVQQMVNAEAAGILFTANPSNGQRSQAIIDAAWGLGEAVVGGLVTPDRWTVEKESGRILARAIADKEKMTVRTENGAAEQPVPVAKRRQPAISEQTALALTRYGTQIEAHYGMPMDIEWAVADGEIAILQARPITALPEPTADPPSDWPVPVARAMFVRGSITEQMPDPLSPLFGTLAPSEMSRSIRSLLEELIDGAPSDIMGFSTVNGYVYIFMKTNAELWWFLARAMGALALLFRIGADYWRKEFLPRYRQSMADWQGKPPQEWSATELLAGARELTYRGTELYTGVQMVIPLAIMSEIGFAEFYNRLVKRSGDPPAQTFLLGFDSQPIRAEKSLYDLAMWSRDQKALADLLAKTPSDEVLKLLNREQPPADVHSEIWQEWRTHFHAHLDEYGHAIYNLDFVHPVPADDPAPLFETLKFYMQGQGTNPYARQQDSAKRRDELTRATLARLDPMRGTIFQKLLVWAQRIAPIREDALATVGLGWPLLRRLLLELGHRLAEAGAIAQPKEIFWLEETEVARMANALDAGETRFDSLAEAVAERKMQWRGQKRATPPQILPENNGWLNAAMEPFMPAGSADQTGPVIKGVAVGEGRVTAPARVLAGPEDFGQMKPGEVLVADITTPAWTPLFALAAAVVTDVGGPMSHGSIVAREYGIPAVLGTGIATKRIQSGQQIRVDGDAGTVTLLDEVNAAFDGNGEVAEGVRKRWIFALTAGVIGVIFWWRRRRRKG